MKKSLSILILILIQSAASACSGARPAANREPGSDAVVDYKEPVWNVFESQQNHVTAFRAEKGLQTSTVTKITAFNDAKTIELKDSEAHSLRERVSELTTQIPKKPGAKSKEECPHWVEIESFYGKRFFCEGYESDRAMELIHTLHEMMAK